MTSCENGWSWVARVAATLAFGAGTAGAQTVETVGVRALGMGGAFVAVADDATAVYWNPAGLGTGALFSLVLDRQIHEMRQADDTSDVSPATSGSAITIALGAPPLGLSHYRLRTSLVGRGLSAGGNEAGRRPAGVAPGLEIGSLETSHTGVTVLQSVGPGAIVGATLKLVRGTAVLQPAAEGATAGDLLARAERLTGEADHAFDLDLGAMVSEGPVRLGLVVRNLREPAFGMAGDRLKLERQVRIGLAVLPSDEWLLAVDADLTRTGTALGPQRNVAIGGERWILRRRVGLRAGLRASTVGDARPAAAAGVSIGVARALWVETQLTRGRRDADRSWGLAARVAF